MFNCYFNPFMNYYMQFGLLQSVLNQPNYYANSYYQYPDNQYFNSIFAMNRPTGYNAAKGDVLVRNALAGLPSQNPEVPLCARYVKNAVVNSGLGNYVYGNGQDSKYMFRGNQNFMEVKVSGSDLPNLPKGSAIVYDAFDVVKDPNGNYSQIGENGHVLFVGENHTGISDRLESFIPQSDRAYVFIPV